MPKPKTPQTTQVAFRFTVELIDRIDHHVERMRAATPGVEYNRADAVRSLLTTALDAVEKKNKKR